MRALLREQLHERQGGRRLAAAGLAREAERLAIVQSEAHPVDGLDPARFQLEVGPQVLDGEQRGGRVRLLGQRPLAPAADGHRVVGRRLREDRLGGGRFAPGAALAELAAELLLRVAPGSSCSASSMTFPVSPGPVGMRIIGGPATWDS